LANEISTGIIILDRRIWRQGIFVNEKSNLFGFIMGFIAAPWRLCDNLK